MTGQFSPIVEALLRQGKDLSQGSYVKKMRSEDLDEESVVDGRDAVDPHNPEGEGNGDTAPVHEHTGWLSHLLPHMSIPLPSVPALSARLPFTRNRQSSGRNRYKG